MKLIIGILLIMLISLQYKLWIADRSLTQVHHLQKQKQDIITKNKTLKARNATLFSEIANLKQGLGTIEEYARSEMGLIKKGETFYQLVPQDFTPEKK